MQRFAKLRKSPHIEDESQLAVWSLPRAILCIDYYYDTEKLIDGKTIYDFERELQKSFADLSIRVRMSSTVFNQKGICICFKPLSVKSPEASMTDLLSSLLPNTGCRTFKFDCTIAEATVRLPIIFIPLAQMDSLLNAIAFVQRNNLIAVLQDKIGKLYADELDTRVNEAIEKAKVSYQFYQESEAFSVGKLARTLDVVGLYQSHRRSVATSRIEDLQAQHPEMASSKLLQLLLDEESSCDLSSLNYCIASALVGISVQTNEEAVMLVNLVKIELDRRVANPIKAPKFVAQISAIK